MSREDKVLALNWDNSERAFWVSCGIVWALYAAAFSVQPLLLSILLPYSPTSLPWAIPSWFLDCKSSLNLFPTLIKKIRIKFEGRINKIYEQSRAEQSRVNMVWDVGRQNKKKWKNLLYLQGFWPPHLAACVFYWDWKDWKSSVGLWICFASEDAMICLFRKEMSSIEFIHEPLHSSDPHWHLPFVLSDLEFCDSS